MISASERRERLKQLYLQAQVCRACQLHETRTNVVFGAGNADAELMFVGEAPGATEDVQGLPFVGQAGKLLDQLLGEISLERSDVFITNTIKCRPPGNRDPYQNELDACSHYLFSQLELIAPTMVCTLGNFATKLLRGDPTGITRLHGRPEVRTIGSRAVRLYPLYHPAAALYTPSNLELLRDDFQRIPAILALGPPPQPGEALIGALRPGETGSGAPQPGEAAIGAPQPDETPTSAGSSSSGQAKPTPRRPGSPDPQLNLF